MTQTDVLILGGGLVGGALAVALGKHGLGSVVVDPADPAVMLAHGFDGRASAVASASGRMLDANGIGARLDGQGVEIRKIDRESVVLGERLSVRVDLGVGG